jgi:hypothetical protein
MVVGRIPLLMGYHRLLLVINFVLAAIVVGLLLSFDGVFPVREWLGALPQK